MVKICFFLGGFHQNGGIGRVTSMLANTLVEKDEFSITALCYCNPYKTNFYSISEKIHQLFFLDRYSSMTKQLFCGGVGDLRKILCDNDIDILVACGALFFPISVLACNGIKTKCVCWEHSNPEGNNDHRGQYLARKFGVKRSDLNVVLTKRALKVYKEKYKANNTIQIYNPVDDMIISSDVDYDVYSKKILSVGRLTYQKNFQSAVRIASKVLPKFPDWEWDVYGKGDDYNELERMVESFGINNQMHFKGQLPNLYNYYKNYSFMVMTSRYEGFPMSLLEGLGNKLPLISYDIPTGPSEIIEDGVNGFLLEEGKEEDMANRISELIQDKDLRMNMSKASKEKIVNFSTEDICNVWARSLKSLI